MAKLKIRNDEGQFVEVGACHIPSGGTTNQVLTKIDSTDYNIAWQDVSNETPLAIDNIEYETGELYNGKKVYAKTLVTSSPIYGNSNLNQYDYNHYISGAERIWIDYSKSFISNGTITYHFDGYGYGDTTDARIIARVEGSWVVFKSSITFDNSWDKVVTLKYTKSEPHTVTFTINSANTLSYANFYYSVDFGTTWTQITGPTTVNASKIKLKTKRSGGRAGYFYHPDGLIGPDKEPYGSREDGYGYAGTGAADEECSHNIFVPCDITFICKEIEGRVEPT